MANIEFNRKYISHDKLVTITPTETITDFSGPQIEVKILCKTEEDKFVTYTEKQLEQKFTVKEPKYPTVHVGRYYRSENSVDSIFSTSCNYGELTKVGVHKARGIFYLKPDEFFSQYKEFEPLPDDVWLDEEGRRFKLLNLIDYRYAIYTDISVELQPQPRLELPFHVFVNYFTLEAKHE